MRKTASFEALSRGPWSLDVGATHKGEGILALGWEHKAGPMDVGVQAGMMGDLSTRPNLAWYAAATVRL